MVNVPQRAITKDPNITKNKEWLGEPNETLEHLQGRMRAEGDDPANFTFSEDQPEIVGKEPMVIRHADGLHAALKQLLEYFGG